LRRRMKTAWIVPGSGEARRRLCGIREVSKCRGRSIAMNIQDELILLFCLQSLSEESFGDDIVAGHDV
jgi:hypothetical protein